MTDELMALAKGYELGLQRAAEEARHVSRGYVAYQAMACLEVADRIDQIPRNPKDDVCTRHDGADKPLIEATKELPALIAERDALREALAKATKPSFYWDSEDSENGCDDLAVIMDNHDLGYVARLQCAATLPDQWAVGFVNDTGGFEARAFATEAEAVAFSEARAALGASHDAK